MTTAGTGTARIPDSHVDLLTRPVHGVLTTLMPDGQPQSSLVWVGYDGDRVTVPTTRERRKGRNIMADDRVSLLVVDPDDSTRYLQIRGHAELVEPGALDHLDELTRAYTPHPRFYGYVYPISQQARETRVICRIRASRTTVNAIHA